VPFESVDRHTAEGFARWQAAGSPAIPSIEIDGTSTLIMHVSQVAALLGLPAPPAPAATRLAYDIAVVVDSWAANVRALPWELVVAESPSRGRSIRNLTMNAVYPISLLPAAYATGTFEWGLVDMDEQLARGYGTTEALADFARRVHDEYAAFVFAHEDVLAESDPWIDAPRGRMRFSDLLGHQRFHISFHHRQVVAFLQERGVEPAHPFRVEHLDGLTLPGSVF